MNTKYRIETLKAFHDNYIYVIHNNSEAIVIDPGDSTVVEKFIDSQNLTLKSILLTHSHPDHIGGVSSLKQKYECSIYSHDPSLNFVDTLFTSDEDTFTVLELSVKMIFTPGHTPIDCCYYIPELKALFSGDLIFCCGCGATMTNDYELMYNSLLKVKNLPQETKIYFAHDYTDANLVFTKSIQTSVRNIDTYIRYLNIRKETRGLITPTTIENEFKYNPFLRVFNDKEFREDILPNCNEDDIWKSFYEVRLLKRKHNKKIKEMG